MLRGLNGNGIVDSAFRIGPKVGCDLEAGAERNEQTVGNVTLGKAKLLRTGAIDFYAQLRCVRYLVQSNINRPWNLFHPRLDLTRDRVVWFFRVAGNLDVDRRR